ncbi:MAG: MBOAT family protein [Flavobacteriales bacterium]|nr:MBOAT family protein [Flavobacteriales bacterium]
MLFHSFAFLVFLPVVYLLYWYVFNRSLRLQNMFVLAASYVFYGWWDWRFLGLLIASSAGDFLLALAIDRASTQPRRKALLIVSLVVNLGLLATFKYFNFFREGLADMMLAIGLQPDLPTLHLILPVGISFYTFQSLSYTIDIYRRQMRATHDPVEFMAFVGFFPPLVAGPIERAANLLPQFQVPRRFDMGRAKDGLRQMLWGFFKKMVIADGCAPVVDEIFGGDISSTPGITLFFGAFFFAFQIYGDFSGYSDIAIGCGRLFGFNLSRNFAYPYFSRNIAEFWRRWHISLSTWFRDYVYMPLGGWRTKAGRFRNILITFTVSGLWHGANWTFINWGLLHGVYHIPRIASDAKTRRDDATLRELPAMLLTFLLVLVAWVFFRAEDMRHALDYLDAMVRNLPLRPRALLTWAMHPATRWIALMLVVEWLARRHQHALEALPAQAWRRWAVYIAIVLVILLHMDMRSTHEFIYFQF